MSWTWVITDRDGVEFGELRDISNESVKRILCGARTAQFDLSWTDDLSLVVDDDDTPLLLKVYDESKGLIFHGRILDPSSVYGQSINVSAIDAVFDLDGRLLNKTSPYSASTQTGERGDIAKTIIDLCNTDSNTGIKADAANIADTSTTTVEWSWTNALQALQELSLGQVGSMLQGFDWILEPQEMDVNDRIVSLRVGTPSAGSEDLADRLIGRDMTHIIFEQGPDTANTARGARKVSSTTGMANSIYHVPDEATTAVHDQSTISINKHGLFEDVLNDEIYDAGLRDDIVDGHLTYRKDPRRLIEFQPVEENPATPVFGVDYDLGDVITLRVMEQGVLVIDAAMRVYAVESKLNEVGIMQHTLTLTPETA